MTIRSLCVYCGASAGTSAIYTESAYTFGSFLAQRGITVIYGGGRVGVMGALADGALAAGGRVIGIIPEKLAIKELAHTEVTELEVVSTMHDRKTRMAELADAFVALPGGIGTFEELFEALTWTQLGYHDKPCGLLNIASYFDHLDTFLTHSVTAGFLQEKHRAILSIHSDPAALLRKMEQFTTPAPDPWMAEQSTPL